MGDVGKVIVEGNAAGTPVPVSGTVTIIGGPITVDQGTSPWVINGTVAVSGTVAVTQSTSPWVVSGTITANQGTSPWVVSLASTTITGTVAVTQSTSPWVISSAQLPAALVGGRLDINNGAWLGSTAPTVGQKTMANSIPVVLASDQASIPVTLTSTTITGTVAVTQSTTPWVANLTQWGSVAVTAAAALADNAANPTAPRVGASLLGLNIAGTWDRIAAGRDDTDAQAAVALGALLALARNYIWNGTTWQRIRGNSSTGALLTELDAVSATITVTGGANAIATATLPAAGVGLFHYITHIHISRVATAALAGGAILTITTTNLNGRSWRTNNQASITVATFFNQPFIEAEFTHPLKSQVANTNTTIVCPAAGAAVSWHIVVDYFIGA